MSLLAAGPALAAAAAPGLAATPVERRVSGTFAGGTWEARSLIVGQTSTAVVPPGDPIYLPARPDKNGVAFLEIFGGGYCSGSLIGGGTAILTAAHCVTNASGTITATGGWAYFYPGPADPFYDLDFGFVPGIQRVALGAVHVAPGYTGDVIDHNDLAIIFLAGAAPAFATSYLLDALVDPTGVVFNVAGFGNRGVGATVGASPGSFGRLREGDNMFEYALGNPIFGGGWAGLLGRPLGQISDSWVSDFDRVGFAANDTSCLVTGGLLGTGATFCNTGLGPREVGVAGGDSGGPQFVNGRIVSVTSYGLTFGTAWGDCRAGLQSSCGEFSGFAPVFRNRAWIERLVPGAFVPEPGTWGMLIAGFGLVGMAARRRKAAAAA
nr:PEPxxWA-CTERM sorting domain-containing protein [Thermaurantiacus tibetensis]